MEQKFCFVDCAQIDKATKKRMRRHVMMGKNAGKTIHRKSRRAINSQDQIVRPGQVSSVVKTEQVRWDMGSKFEFYNPASIYTHVLAGLSFPVELTPHFAQVISTFLLLVANRLYPVELGISLEASKYTWMSILLSDKAAFFCNLALMQACNELFLGEGENSPVAMYHLSNSLTYVRERLESKEALSDSTMGIVMSLVTQEQVRNQHKAAKIHMDGLAQMIKLRGGLESLENSRAIVLKACKTDLMYTIQNSTAPHFNRNAMPFIKRTLSTLSIPFSRTAALSQVQHPHLAPALLDVLLDVISTATLFNSPSLPPKIDLYLYHELLISIFYRLLAVPVSHPPAGIEDAYHVGLTLFMMSLFLQHRPQRIMTYDRVIRRLRGVLESDVLHGEEGLRLWVTMVGGVWVQGEEAEEEWLVLMLGAQVESMGLTGWGEAMGCLERWPWIGALHDGPGRTVWERALRGRDGKAGS